MQFEVFFATMRFAGRAAFFAAGNSLMNLMMHSFHIFLEG
jgi:hypothetical protein